MLGSARVAAGNAFAALMGKIRKDRLPTEKFKVTKSIMQDIANKLGPEKSAFLASLVGYTIVIAGVTYSLTDLFDLADDSFAEVVQRMTPSEGSELIRAVGQKYPAIAGQLATLLNVISDPATSLISEQQMDTNHMGPLVAGDDDHQKGGIIFGMNDLSSLQQHTRAWIELTRYIPRESIEFLIMVVTRMPLETRNVLADNARAMRRGFY